MRSQQMMGKDARYIPGWDCHGLPIEWKIEEQYRKKGKNKDEVNVIDFRQECRKFAEGWVDIQRSNSNALGYRQMGKPLSDDEFPCRTRDRRGIYEIPDEWHAVSGIKTCDVVAH